MNHLTAPLQQIPKNLIFKAMINSANKSFLAEWRDIILKFVEICGDMQVLETKKPDSHRVFVA